METSTQIDGGKRTVTEGSLLPAISETYTYAETIGYAVCLMTNIFGNTLTLVSIRKFSFLQSKTYMTLKLLTIADLVMTCYAICTFLLRFEAVDLTNIVQVYLVYTFGVFAAFSAVLHVLLVAVDRFIAVVFPYFYSTKVTKQSLIVMSVFAWVTSIILAVVYMGVHSLMLQGNYFPYLIDIFIYLIMLGLLLVTHGKVACVARSKRTQIVDINMQDSSEGNKKTKKIKKIDRATLMMLVMVGVYLLLWFPIILTSVIMVVTSEATPTTNYIRILGAILVTSNSSVNFIIYAVVNRRFRYAYKLLLTCKKLDGEDISFQSTLNTIE